jgi:hypothetical protein
MGGLGNQMFQYAFGRANINDTRYTLSWYVKSKNVHRPYRLDKFNTKINLHKSIKNTIYEKHRGFDMSLLKMDGFNFVGYWQYYPYFKDIIPCLREELVVKEQYHTKKFLALRDKITSTNSVSVHVRRGDYLVQKGFHELPFHYYIRALGYVKGELFVFSDDISWCKSKFNDYFSNITFVDIEDYLAFELMRLCKQNVTTNSTFSYWAAILNDNPNKIVISPYKWLGDQVIDDKLRFPEEWIKIPDYVV